MHTCTRDIAVLRAQNRQSASWALWSTSALPNRPSRTFAYVYEGFGCSESPKRTFGALGLFRAVQIAMRVRWADGQTDGELGSRDGLPYGGPGSHSQPRPLLKGPWPIHIPCAGLQAFPPHSNLKPSLLCRRAEHFSVGGACGGQCTEISISIII